MRTLEDSWIEISPYLDEVLGLDTYAREMWLGGLEARAPAIAAWGARKAAFSVK